MFERKENTQTIVDAACVQHAGLNRPYLKEQLVNVKSSLNEDLRRNPTFSTSQMRSFHESYEDRMAALDAFQSLSPYDVRMNVQATLVATRNAFQMNVIIFIGTDAEGYEYDEYLVPYPIGCIFLICEGGKQHPNVHWLKLKQTAVHLLDNDAQDDAQHNDKDEPYDQDAPYDARFDASFGTQSGHDDSFEEDMDLGFLAEDGDVVTGLYGGGVDGTGLNGGLNGAGLNGGLDNLTLINPDNLGLEIDRHAMKYNGGDNAFLQEVSLKLRPEFFESNFEFDFDQDKDPYVVMFSNRLYEDLGKFSKAVKDYIWETCIRLNKELEDVKLHMIDDDGPSKKLRRFHELFNDKVLGMKIPEGFTITEPDLNPANIHLGKRALNEANAVEIRLENKKRSLEEQKSTMIDQIRLLPPFFALILEKMKPTKVSTLPRKHIEPLPQGEQFDLVALGYADDVEDEPLTAAVYSSDLASIENIPFFRIESLADGHEPTLKQLITVAAASHFRQAERWRKELWEEYGPDCDKIRALECKSEFVAEIELLYEQEWAFPVDWMEPIFLFNPIDLSSLTSEIDTLPSLQKKKQESIDAFKRGSLYYDGLKQEFYTKL